ncbi:hypothetical protein P7K49_025027 [Saguinus oedipus]|uniref:ABC transporter domain-containing protein n=1 Tax=Saguinus oedipus TaxID=9490 RepID=A0ABQ9UHD3_SAGOE|nr:hypothetical protein P7K49_025027 [Saguinus oedipus]
MKLARKHTKPTNQLPTNGLQSTQKRSWVKVKPTIHYLHTLTLQSCSFTYGSWLTSTQYIKLELLRNQRDPVSMTPAFLSPAVQLGDSIDSVSDHFLACGAQCQLQFSTLESRAHEQTSDCVRACSHGLFLQVQAQGTSAKGRLQRRSPWKHRCITQRQTSSHHGSSLQNRKGELEGNPPGVTLVSVTKEYEGHKAAVQDLSLTFYTDQITALLGTNGAGKTTIVSMLMGLYPPTSGTIIINGKNLQIDLSKVRMELGVCPQQDILLDNLTVREHLLIFASIKAPQWTKKELHQQINRSPLHHASVEMPGLQLAFLLAVGFSLFLQPLWLTSAKLIFPQTQPPDALPRSLSSFRMSPVYNTPHGMLLRMYPGPGPSLPTALQGLPTSPKEGQRLREMVPCCS